MGFLNFINPVGGPLQAAATGMQLAYPFTQDANFPGVAEARHAKALAMRKAIHEMPGANNAATGAIGSLKEIPGVKNAMQNPLGTVGDIAQFIRDPYGIAGKTHAPAAAMTPEPTPAPVQQNPQPPPQQMNSPAMFGPGSANERVAQGFNALGSTPMQTAMHTPAPLPTPQPAQEQPEAPRPPVVAQDDPAPKAWAGPHSVGGAPLDYSGPNSVGGAPLEGTDEQWNNLGPKQASGPDVINKLMSYFHQKDDPTG